MKKVFLKSCSVVLAVFTVVSLFCINAFATQLDDDIESVWMNPGETIEIGSYPQSLVEDSQLISRLNSQSKTWISYKYPRGENIVRGDWMKYCDVTLEETKYRGVVFYEYMPALTNYDNVDEENNIQRDNGYRKNTVYWFKYEPIKWIALETCLTHYRGKSVLVTFTTEKIIDCQPFDENLFLDENDKYYRDAAFSQPYVYSYANSYYRNFLLDSFAKTAFSSEEYEKIDTYTNFRLNGEEIRDDVMINVNAPEKQFRKSVGTDYAKVQGLSVDDSGNGEYWIYGVGDTYYPGGNASCEIMTSTGNHSGFGRLVNSNYIGVRPYIEILVLDATDYCDYCEDKHDNGFFDKIVAFFHNILYWFKNLF